MYTVQYKSVVVETPGHHECEWIDLHTVPQLDTEQSELNEARQVAALGREFHKCVRIVESTVGGTYLEEVA